MRRKRRLRFVQLASHVEVLRALPREHEHDLGPPIGWRLPAEHTCRLMSVSEPQQQLARFVGIFSNEAEALLKMRAAVIRRETNGWKIDRRVREMLRVTRGQLTQGCLIFRRKR